MGAELWADYATFHRYSVATRDVDPAYPVLKTFLWEQGIDPNSDEGIWMSVHHLTWYDIGSAAAAWWSQWHLTSPVDWTKLPCATERRGNRDSRNLLRNIKAWQDAAGRHKSIKRYLTHGLSDDPYEAWEQVRTRTEAVWGNGRWASYKLAEILNKVNGVPLMFGDMGHKDSSGPRQGMALLVDELPEGNGEATIRELNDLSDMLTQRLTMAGITAKVEEVETTLCDFHALHGGRYYVGHDIDAMLEQVNKTPGPWTDHLLQARFDVLLHPYLGELGGWPGVDRDRSRVYKDTGKVVVR